MSFVKFLTQKLLETNVRKLERPDIWRLYHLVHFYKTRDDQIPQNEVNLPDQKAALSEQYSIVHKNIQQQVS